VQAQRRDGRANGAEREEEQERNFWPSLKTDWEKVKNMKSAARDKSCEVHALSLPFLNVITFQELHQLGKP
jgi:hypothetical protein